MGHDKGYMDLVLSHPGLCSPCPSLFSSAVLCYFCFPFSSLPQGSVVSISAAPFNLLSPPPRSWHWSFSTHTGYKHSKLQIREEKKKNKNPKTKLNRKTSAIWHLNSKVKHWKQKHKLVLHPKRDSQQRLQQSLQGKMCQIEGMDQLPGL